MGLRFLQIAVVYLVLGVVVGGYMGATRQFFLIPVHTHLLLTGWASLALAGLIYHLYPATTTTRLARIHFRLHNVGLPIFVTAFALTVTGHEWARVPLGASAGMLIGGFTAFAINVLMHAKPADTLTTRSVLRAADARTAVTHANSSSANIEIHLNGTVNSVFTASANDDAKLSLRP